MNTRVHSLPLALVEVADRLRPVSADYVEMIAASMAERGQDTPIKVGPPDAEGRHRLIAGGHRVAAARQLGWEKIEAIITEATGLEAELAEVDENLMRRELSALDRAVFLAKRKAIYEALNPTAKKGGDRRSDQSRKLASLIPSFRAETAARLGLDETSINRIIRRAELVRDNPGLHEALARHPVADSGAELDRLLEHPADTRAKLIAEALKRMLPSQQRDHSVFHALQAVNLDDHRMDVFVRWEDGSIGRPHLEAVQDIYSGMILGWRLDRSENTQTIRLAIGDVIEEWGIPQIFWFDNTRAAANKQITGGAKTRFRFKVREEDPAGLIEMLGAEVRFTRPYHGQAKPVERAFREAATEWAKDIRFAGAYTGNAPTAKPANYGTAAVPIETFRAVIAERIEEHNSRPGRQSRVCAGRSFRAAFDESYARARDAGQITTATPAQRLLFLLQAEPLTIRSEQPMLHLHGNRYFADWMLGMPGQKVVARFDADALHDDVHCYRLDGSYIGPAECQHAVGFADLAAAREHARKTKALFRAHRQLAELERGMSLQQAAALLPKIERAQRTPEPAPKVVRPLFGTVGTAALKPRLEELEDDLPAHTRSVVTALDAFFPKPARRQPDE